MTYGALYSEKARMRAHPTYGIIHKRKISQFLAQRSRRTLYLIGLICCLAFYWWNRSDAVLTSPSWVPPEDIHTLPCRNLKGANETVMIMKTGATELVHKLSVHFDTTFRCYPHKLIFSDYEEVLHGEQILDALQFVSPETKALHPDFELWRRLQNGGGRKALLPHELSGPVSRVGSNFGKNDNQGWRLDKWKFLPMMNRTLMEYPDKQWYVFVETDTYIMWQNLLNYLAALDHTKPYYVGGQMWIIDELFAHGGTGYAVSRPALQRIVHMFQEHRIDWENWTNAQWAGDCVLGRAFVDSGTKLTKAWPIWQGDAIGALDWQRREEHRLWCSPVVSYHHLTPDTVEDLWKFEQNWTTKVNDPTKILLHKDMYEHYILPRINTPRNDWDNQSDQDHGPIETVEACSSICKQIGACLQYKMSADARCMISTSRPNLGEAARGSQSGWIPSRMRRFYDAQHTCVRGGEGWIMS